jgi:hypothetical protein
MVKQETKKKTYKVIDVITDIFTIPVLLLLLIFTISNLVNHTSNKVSSFFGYSPVTVLSSSMVASGFNVSDVAIIKSTDTKTLETNDIIAFYVYSGELDDSPTMGANIDSLSKKPLVITALGSEVKENESSKGTTYIYFHHINKIVTDTNGKRWFRTKGSSNNVEDSFWTIEDNVIGKYIPAPAWVTGTIKYLSSNNALAWIVIVPAGVLFMLNLFPFFDTLELLIMEKQVVKKKKKLDDDICLKKGLGIGMTTKHKVQILKDAKKKDRSHYFALMWGYKWKDRKKQSKKEKERLRSLNVNYLMSSRFVF